MLVYRFSWVMAVTTNAQNQVVSSPHSGGWSEGFWDTNPIDPLAVATTNETILRATLLPTFCSLTGWKQGIFNMQGNRLLPVGASSGRYNYRGGSFSLNLPQDALELFVPGRTPPGATRVILRALPDECVEQGEYAPTRPFSDRMTNFYRAHFETTNHGWIGRDLNQPNARVLSLTNGVLELENALPGVGQGDFIRLNRVIQDNGDPVSGSFRVSATPVGATYVLVGAIAFTVSEPSGTARRDVLIFNRYADRPTGQRAVVRKIGRPTESYRGRRSRVRR